MNRIERVVDQVDPGLSVRLRMIKMALRQDAARHLIRTMISPADVVVDVGANRGVYTCLMSAQVGPGGRVHAVEPFPGNCERLRVMARRRGNITLHQHAASDRAGSAVLRVPVHAGRLIDALATLEPGRGEECCEVSVRTLDELLAGERRISFLKCDVEGHEQRVFAGAARILERDRPVVFAEVEQRHRPEPVQDTFGFFADAGYQGWYVSRGALRPLAEFDVARDQLGFLDGRFIPYGMPDGYVSDFLFCPPGVVPPLAGTRPGWTPRPAPRARQRA